MVCYWFGLYCFFTKLSKSELFYVIENFNLEYLGQFPISIIKIVFFKKFPLSETDY